MLALIAVNSLVMSEGVEAKTITKSTKIVQSVKHKKKLINRAKVKLKLISYARRKGMMFEKKLQQGLDQAVDMLCQVPYNQWA